MCTLVYTALQTAALIRVMADAVSVADTILTETVRTNENLSEKYREYWFTRLCLGDVVPRKPEAQIEYQKMDKEAKATEAAAVEAEKENAETWPWGKPIRKHTPLSVGEKSLKKRRKRKNGSR